MIGVGVRVSAERGGKTAFKRPTRKIRTQHDDIHLSVFFLKCGFVLSVSCALSLGLPLVYRHYSPLFLSLVMGVGGERKRTQSTGWSTLSKKEQPIYRWSIESELKVRMERRMAESLIHRTEGGTEGVKGEVKWCKWGFAFSPPLSLSLLTPAALTRLPLGCHGNSLSHNTPPTHLPEQTPHTSYTCAHAHTHIPICLFQVLKEHR